ncbi:hypothetical protein ACODYM_28775 [Burkholderia gladioli]|uniref:hypothetical protein n=1 Tax=Burkholderia gladioli TaxID=28095 RepID=UPI003B505367
MSERPKVVRIQLLWSEVRALMDEPGYEHVDSDTSYRHGSYETFVVLREGKFYQATVPHNTQHGYEIERDYPIDLIEVTKKEVVTHEWVAVTES